MEQIFATILQSPANIEFTVKVSYMEIYMEKVRDLLNRKVSLWNAKRFPFPDWCPNFLASHDNLPIHEDKVKGVYVKGLLEVYVSSTEEVYEVMRRGGNNRVVAYTRTYYKSSLIFCNDSRQP